MRPYLILCAVLLIAVAAFGQQPVPRPYGYGYGPFVPMMTTPMVSLETVSPNPVGASNATTGLIAGATNSTLSQVEGSTSSDYTVAVWYQGGSPLVTPEVNIWPEPLGREQHAMHHPMGEEAGRERGPVKEEKHAWLYFTGAEYTADVVSAASAGKGARKAGHVYTNDDVTRQNDNNGLAKWDGKSEKIQ
ncbi:MAG: hypothetical protein WBS24_15435 [Terriglobales bacterium]